MMVEELRVFVNERAVRVARGATVQDAVAALDGDLAALLASDAAYVTDGVGRPVDAGGPVGEGGGIFRVVVTARRGPPRMSKEVLRRWPKAELHVHLDGCLRPETMLELARAQGIRLPADTPDTLTQALSVKGSRSLEEYLSKYEITLSVMQTAAALDLGGAERGHPAGEHRGAFEQAARHGLACTCHAGEGDGPHSIHEALHACGARRIGHGTRLGEDPALLAYVVEHKIPLEMCLTSNVHTRTVAALAEHPFKRYLEQGVVVTLSTDGRLMDGISLTDEYYLAHAVLGLSRQDLARVVLHSCESAFLPDYEKVALISRVQSELERNVALRVEDTDTPYAFTVS